MPYDKICAVYASPAVHLTLYSSHSRLWVIAPLWMMIRRGGVEDYGSVVSDTEGSESPDLVRRWGTMTEIFGVRKSPRLSVRRIEPPE